MYINHQKHVAWRLRPGLPRLFEEYADAYPDVIRDVSYIDLQRSQGAPYASLAFGGAGVAYVLWRAAVERNQPALLNHADRWLTETLATSGEEAAFFAPHTQPADHPGSRTSFYYGLSGLYFVQALIADSQGAAKIRRQALSHFITNCRETLSGRLELLRGVAGCLVGATLLSRRIEDERLERMILELANCLVRRAATNSVDSIPWSELGLNGMAHGRRGVYFALLSAAANSSLALPGWFLPSLRRFAEIHPLPTPASTASADGADARSRWCTGSAGLAPLWVKAYQATHDRFYLQLARQAATRAYGCSDDYPDLCCGSGGRAYALLSVGRIDPHPKWRRRAAELAEQALGSRAPSKWPFGLFKGQSGLFCLASDLLKPEGAGFPCLEALPCS